MTVQFVRPEYSRAHGKWELVRACVTRDVADYIADINPHDMSAENKDRNTKRRSGAKFYNVTGRTLRVLNGVAFSKWPEVKLPDSLAYLKEDASGTGMGLINQCQKAVGDVLQTARAGLMVDAEAAEGTAYRKDKQRRATITLFPAEAIINWRVENNRLNMVVLKIKRETWQDFELVETDRYLALTLQGNVYTVTEYDHAGLVTRESRPTDKTGKTFDFIPFQFIGASDNDVDIDEPPLLDIADLNIGHYVNSADYEESLFFAGQSQLVITGIDEHWLKVMKEEGMYVGSRAPISLPYQADAKLIQAQAVTALSEEMARKEERMAALGARIIQNGTVAKTATQSGSEDKVGHSILSLVADNVSQAYTKALEWVGQFMGVSGEASLNLPTEYSSLQFDSQQLAQALAANSQGKLPDSDLFAYLRAIGLIDATKSDEDVKDELEGMKQEAVGFDEVDGGAPVEDESLLIDEQDNTRGNGAR